MNTRLIHVYALIGIVFLLYSFKLLDLQVIDDKYKAVSANNIIQTQRLTPLRGTIIDRNDKVLVRNKAVFEIKILPFKVNRDDIPRLAEIFNLEVSYIENTLKKALKYSKYKPYTLIDQLHIEEFAKIQDLLTSFTYIINEPHFIREYPHQSLSHVLGYIKEVSASFLKRDTLKIYRQGDRVGVSGLEKYYEDTLRGSFGFKHVMMDVNGVIRGSFEDGSYDEKPIAGKDIKIGIDLDLQQYAEFLMQGKKGSIVAIEPSSGEILCMVSAPFYDPNSLSGKGKNMNAAYRLLEKHEGKPLFNRVMQSVYAPGSTFKTIVALAGLQEGALDTNTSIFACNKSVVGCHTHPQPLGLYRSIQHSCNPYYYVAMRKLIFHQEPTGSYQGLRSGLSTFNAYAMEFGLGKALEIDLPYNKNKGLLPKATLYDRIYGKDRWKFSRIRSISIGQGEVTVLPIQLANQAATIANRGWYITPHLVKSIEGKSIEVYTKKHKSSIDSAYFNFIARAMEEVVRSGTAPLAYHPRLRIAGKTGTAQNPHGKDHSIFMCFAPIDKPKIAIAVHVENAGFGGNWAAPMASLITEKYLTGEVSENRKWVERLVLRDIEEVYKF